MIVIQVAAIAAGVAIPILESRASPSYDMELGPLILGWAAEFALAVLTLGIWVYTKKLNGIGEERDGIKWLLYLTAGGVATMLVFPVGLVMNLSVVLILGGMNIYRLRR